MSFHEHLLSLNGQENSKGGSFPTVRTVIFLHSFQIYARGDPVPFFGSEERIEV
jgi:hypothetical protein